MIFKTHPITSRSRGKGLAVIALAFVSSLWASPAVPPAVDEAWPRKFPSTGGTVLTMYQPQLDRWDGRSLAAHAAVSVLLAGASESTFGIVWISARTNVDKENRLVDFDQVEISRAVFPSAPASEGAYLDLFRAALSKGSKPIALDRLEASLAILEERRKGAALPLRNDPPHILFSSKPAILVSIDGPPAYRGIKGTSFERVLNTRPLLVKAPSGTCYLHLFDGWMTAPSIEGPWVAAPDPPSELGETVRQLVESGQPVDLLEGEAPQASVGSATGTASTRPPAKPSLARDPVPSVFVATSPTELIVTAGEPDWVAVDGAGLLYVENTTGNVFKALSDQKVYVLISGRWYRGASESGPWEYVSGRALPAEFANIPDDSPKENVKASVPGTSQAAEALIADEIPQTAKVDVHETTMTPPDFDGEPKLAAIEGTPLQYVVNASLPVVLADDLKWYSVENGVWFVAGSLRGPWEVARSVPPSIYAIPPDSPLHYVTYVRIYDTSDDFVDVGYTPGYTGTYVDDDGLIVYGTGYPYAPWIGDAWYGPPITWGFGFGLAWTPWWGWTFDAGFGWGWDPWWTWGCLPAPWWGPVGWGWHSGGWHWHDGARVPPVVPWRPGGWNSASGGMYRRWGRTVAVPARPVPAVPTTRHPVGLYGRAYNSHTGALAAGQHAAVRNVYPPPSGSARNDVYAGADGRVYRRDARGNWQQVGPHETRPPERQRVAPLEREHGARTTGDQRSRAVRPPGPPPRSAPPPRAAPPSHPAAPRPRG